jgi:hypothetical protein
VIGVIVSRVVRVTAVTVIESDGDLDSMIVLANPLPWINLMNCNNISTDKGGVVVKLDVVLA